jgi:hypothetical protein
MAANPETVASPESAASAEPVAGKPAANPFFSGGSPAPPIGEEKEGSPAKPSSPFQQNTEVSTGKSPKGGGFQAVGAATGAPAARGSSPFGAASDSPTIKLSAGVALPQTGPNGILMSFSVDYEAAGTPANASAVWVIERTTGKPAKIPVRLANPQGNLVTLIQGWRPETGPFQGHLEDKKGKRLSASVELLGQE